MCLVQDFNSEMLEWTPDDTTLENISHHIGDKTFQLGIELGLTVNDLQGIEHSHKDLIEQTREVLKKWKESLNPEEHERPVITLAKSLKRVDRYIVIGYLKDNFYSKIYQPIQPWRTFLTHRLKDNFKTKIYQIMTLWRPFIIRQIYRVINEIIRIQ